MARFCSKCGKKFKLFENDFNGLCIDCFNEFQEEEKERKKRQYNKHSKYIKEEFIKYINLMLCYSSIVSSSYTSREKCSIKEVLKEILKLLVGYLPINFSYEDIDAINTKEILLEVADNINPLLDTSITIDTDIIRKSNNYFPHEKVFYRNNDILNYLLVRTSNDLLTYDYIINDIIDKDADAFKKETDTSIQFQKAQNNNESIISLYKYKKAHDEAIAEQNLIKIEDIFNYAIMLLYNLNFCKNVEIFENNSELSTMFKNLSDSTDDINYINEKLFYIYTNLYSNIFNEEMDIVKFSYLIFVKNTNRSLKLSENFVEYIKNNMSCKEKEKIILNNLQQNHTDLLLHIKDSNDMDENEKIAHLKIAILTNIISIKDKITFDELLSLLGDLEEMAKEIYNNLELSAAQKERERLLKGDMITEENFENDKLDYSNIQNGYDFEEYVANLYRKLGYKIDKVTKKSGDQGADIIAYNDNIKYVIQVKFYNSPVGNKAVQEVVGALGMYNAQKGIVVTNSTYTPSAIELANANHIELVDGNTIDKMKQSILKSSSKDYLEIESKIDEKVEEINKLYPNLHLAEKYALAYSELTNYAYKETDEMDIVINIMDKVNDTGLSNEDLKLLFMKEIHKNHIKFAFNLVKNNMNEPLKQLTLKELYYFAYISAYEAEELFTLHYNICALMEILQEQGLIENDIEKLIYEVQEMQNLIESSD